MRSSVLSFFGQISHDLPDRFQPNLHQTFESKVLRFSRDFRIFVFGGQEEETKTPKKRKFSRLGFSLLAIHNFETGSNQDIKNRNSIWILSINSEARNIKITLNVFDLHFHRLASLMFLMLPVSQQFTELNQDSAILPPSNHARLNF